MIIRLVYTDGVFMPVTPLNEIEDGAQIAFEWPDDVYLCDSDRQAALDAGRVVLLETLSEDDE